MKRNIFAMERQLDLQNRIVIPAEFRAALNWRTGTTLFVIVRTLRKEIVLSSSKDIIENNCFVRKMDHLGRICVPVEYRNQLGLPKGSSLRIECYAQDDEVRLIAPSNKSA